MVPRSGRSSLDCWKIFCSETDLECPDVGQNIGCHGKSAMMLQCALTIIRFIYIFSLYKLSFSRNTKKDIMSTAANTSTAATESVLSGHYNEAIRPYIDILDEMRALGVEKDISITQIAVMVCSVQIAVLAVGNW